MFVDKKNAMFDYDTTFGQFLLKYQRLDATDGPMYILYVLLCVVSEPLCCVTLTYEL